LGWLAVRLAGGPLLVATKHNLNFIPGQINWFWKNILYRLVLNFPDFVIAVSENLRESLIKTYWLQPRHVVTIHNGINIETFRVTQATNRNALLLRNSWGLSPDDFVVCFTGRLVKEKGLMDLLQAIRTVLALHKKCYLLIVGEGTLLDQLKSKVKELGVEKHVIFAGYRPDIPNILAGIDVLALPSLTEGLPLSILEAMAAGKAIISTPVGGVRELIESGETGILVPTRNPGAMADAIILLLENEQQRKSLGIMARAFVERNFDMEAMLSKYDLVYRKIMRSGM
jgi:glycosyltransferase involved in cell wall biosynthesis